MSLDQFIRLADGLIEFEADLNGNQYPLASCHAVEVHSNELKSNWARIKTAYEKYLHEAEKESQANDDPLDLESFKAKYKSTYITYCNCLTKLSEISESLRQAFISESTKCQIGNTSRPSSSHDLVFQNPGPVEHHNLHLPPVEIPTFHGDYASWPTFRDMFTAVVSNSRASDVEKLFYLTQKTKGEAKEIVQKSPLTNQGFALAWKNLCLRFENRRVLVNGQLKILFNLPIVSCESGKALKQIQRDINSCISILKIYNIDVASWDPIFLYICTSRLPESTLTLWEQELTDKTAIPKWSELDEFLTNRYRTLESVSEIRGSSNCRNVDTKPKPTSTSNSSKKVHSFQVNISGPTCQLCPKESHTIRKCPKFLKMDYQCRLDEIKKEGLCLNCFSKTHSVRNCTSKHNCFKCQKRHNTLLHKGLDNPNLYKQGPRSNLNPNSAPYSSISSSNIQSTNSSGLNKVQSCFAAHTRGILLGTAWVNICLLGIKYQVRALIDSGSEGTFVSERIFNLLRLPSYPTNAQISGLNQTISAKVQYRCSFVLGSRLHEDIAIPVTALVVPQLSSSLPSHTIPRSKFSKLPKIPFADPKFYISSRIDMLIGGDLFPSIVSPGIKHNVCNSLVAQETIFGWILTGPISDHGHSKSTIVSNFCEISVDKEISRFWEVENLPRKNYLSPSDQVCEDLFIRTTLFRCLTGWLDNL